MVTRRSATAIRLRHKLNYGTDDTDWHGSQLDPRILRVTLASSETGTYAVALTPEDDAIDPLEFSYAGTGGDEPTAADGIADEANEQAAASPGWNFLTPDSSNSSAVLLLAIHPNAPQLTASFTPPGSATMTPDHTGALPIVAWGDGEGNLEIKVFAVNSSDAVIAPGSGTVDLQLLSVADRAQPRGADGPDNGDAGPAVVLHRSAATWPLNEPWVVPCPRGWFTVRISNDASLPGSTAALEVWAEKTKAPVSQVYSEDIADGAIGTTEIADLAVTTAKLAADAIDSEHIADGAIDPAHLASTSVAPAANAACAILNTTTEILLTISDATNTAISTTSSVAGQQIFARCVAASGGGSYTLALVSGTLTFNSVGETALIKRNAANSAWMALPGLGSAGGSPATIV